MLTVLPEGAYTQGGASESDVFDKVQQQKDDRGFMASRTAAVFMERGQDPGMARKADMPLLEKDAPKNYAVEENELVADNKLQDVDLNTMTAEELASRPGLLLNMAARTLHGYKHQTGHYAPGSSSSKLALPVAPDPSGMADPFRASEPGATDRPRFEADMAELAIAKDQMDAGQLHQEQKQTAADAMTDDDFSQLGIDIGGHLYWNDVAQGLAVANIGQVPPEVDWARLYIMQLYSSLPDGTWKGTGRALENIFSSPLSYVGLGSVGAIRNLLRGATTKSVTGALKEKLLKGLMGSAWSATIGVEGASYGAMASYLHQRLLWDDESQGPFQLDVEQMKNAALVGGGLGAGLGVGVVGAVKGAQALQRGAEMFSTRQRVGAMAGGDGSVTMGAGYPFAGVEHVIPTEANNDLSMIPMLYNSDVAPVPPKGQAKWTKGVFATDIERRAKASGRYVKKYDDASREMISDTIVDEAVAALGREGNSGNWYNEKITAAAQIMEQIHPEMTPGSTPEGLFKLGLAITSNGSKVDYNLRAAEHIYSVFKDTGHFPDDLKSLEAAVGGFGKEGPTLGLQMRRANGLIDDLESDGFVQFLNMPISVRDLKKLGFDISGEGQDYMTHGSAIFGPKIGGGFYQNLIGNFEPVTFDRWWMGSWGRWTGRAAETATKATKAKQVVRFRAALGDKAPKTDRAVIAAAKRNHKIYVKNGFQPRTEFNKAAQRVAESHTLRMREISNLTTERAFMRETTRSAVEKMRALGHDVTPADLQATVWYPEKELHGHLGIGKGRPDIDDYEAAALKLFEELQSAGGR